jgi:hypothetical protein
MSEHVRNQCKHGIVVSQCRCPGINGVKSTVIVPCPESSERCRVLDAYSGSAICPPPTMNDRMGYGIKAAREEMLRTGTRLVRGQGACTIDSLIEVAVKAALS